MGRTIIEFNKTYAREGERMKEKELIECLSDLCRFLANHQADQRSSMMKAISKENRDDPEKMRDQILMHTPVIQGSKNQWDLQAIGKQDTNTKNIRKAVDYLLDQSPIQGERE